MDNAEFNQIRKKLGKSQKQLAALLGVSLKAVGSYEQGLRSIPAYIERNLIFFLIYHERKPRKDFICWEVKNCHQKEQCPAWEFQSGNMCWFMYGTLCNGTCDSTYTEKIENCRSCIIFNSLIQQDN
ncbi:helix-turn-helix domain-containing protein [Desulfopila aestuarii]|uniref:Helix-turn-helix n=2 Tax=Desulfopila aestuarii TaxID=231440 RepID=A0A1M7YM16_9BACT|nr:helix-turn-helix transcriptional regulator [Desulfopila aestuarii]SHO53640.1 Helix-turn-helix [Desulfopila aestuarii DSM 18488]